MNVCKIFFAFVSLLTVPIVKSSHIEARIYFTFLKNILKQTLKFLIPNINLTEKIGKAFKTK